MSSWRFVRPALALWTGLGLEGCGPLQSEYVAPPVFDGGHDAGQLLVLSDAWVPPGHPLPQPYPPGTPDPCLSAVGALDGVIEGSSAIHLTNGCGPPFGTTPAAIDWIAPGPNFYITACGSQSTLSLTLQFGEFPPAVPGDVAGGIGGEGLVGSATSWSSGRVGVHFTTVAAKAGDTYEGTFDGDLTLPEAGTAAVHGTFSACLELAATE